MVTQQSTHLYVGHDVIPAAPRVSLTPDLCLNCSDKGRALFAERSRVQRPDHFFPLSRRVKTVYRVAVEDGEFLCGLEHHAGDMRIRPNNRQRLRYA